MSRSAQVALPLDDGVSLSADGVPFVLAIYTPGRILLTTEEKCHMWKAQTTCAMAAHLRISVCTAVR